MTPLLLKLNGVSIRIHSREHLPPHLHALSGDEEALIAIRTGELIAGFLPGKQLRLVQNWLAENTNREIAERIFYDLNPQLKPGI